MSMTATTVTTQQIVSTVTAQRYDDTARYLETHGCRLDWDAAAEIGDVGLGWLRTRLGLRAETDDCGVTLRPRETMTIDA